MNYLFANLLVAWLYVECVKLSLCFVMKILVMCVLSCVVVRSKTMVLLLLIWCLLLLTVFVSFQCFYVGVFFFFFLFFLEGGGWGVCFCFLMQG